MDALSHFSYHYTGGECILCDLQGGSDFTRCEVRAMGWDVPPESGVLSSETSLVALRFFASIHLRTCRDGGELGVVRSVEQ